MRELLKRINVAKMCSSTNLNVIRIRNYINGKVAHLSPERKCNHRILWNIAKEKLDIREEYNLYGKRTWILWEWLLLQKYYF